MNTRFATRGDLPEVLDMYMAALDEIRHEILEPDEAACARLVVHSFQTAPCVLLENDGEIAGFAGLKVTTAPYTIKRQLSEYMFYVKPAFRSMKAITALSEACKRVSDAMRLPVFLTLMLSGQKSDDKAGVLSRLGYQPIAVACSYGMNHGIC